MIVISQIQRLFVKVSQPVELLPAAPTAPEGSAPLTLPPNHLKKNMKMNSAMAPPPTIWSARRRRLMSKLIRGFSYESAMDANLARRWASGACNCHYKFRALWVNPACDRSAGGRGVNALERQRAAETGAGQ